MASSHELTKTQIKNLMAATRSNEEHVLRSYEAMQKKFPSGGLTEEQFLEMLKNQSSGAKPTEAHMAKLMFTVADRDKSGKVDLYEYLLTVALLGSDDPKPLIETLFIACDANSDDIVTQDEARYFFSTFLQVTSDSSDDINQEDPSQNKDKLDDIIKLIFGDKLQISEAEFRHACIEKEYLQDITNELYFVLFMFLTNYAKRFEERRCSLIPRP